MIAPSDSLRALNPDDEVGEYLAEKIENPEQDEPADHHEHQRPPGSAARLSPRANDPALDGEYQWIDRAAKESRDTAEGIEAPGPHRPIHDGNDRDDHGEPKQRPPHRAHENSVCNIPVHAVNLPRRRHPACASLEWGEGHQ